MGSCARRMESPRNRRAVIAYLDELWRAAFKRGELKFASPTNRPSRTGPSNRADGMAAEVIETDGANVVDEMDHGFDDACAVATSQIVWDAYQGATVDELAALVDAMEPHVAMAVMGLSAAQDRRRKQRRRESYSTLLQHISDESLKAVIRAEAGPGAANQADRLNGRTAWLTLERECQEPMSALHINTKIIEFNGLTMLKDVGINEQSIIEFSRICVEKNARPPRPRP